eukprot:UN20565
MSHPEQLFPLKLLLKTCSYSSGNRRIFQTPECGILDRSRNRNRNAKTELENRNLLEFCRKVLQV